MRRRERVREILCCLQRQDLNKTILFSDEKFFTLASYSNWHNDQIIWCQGELNTVPDDLRHVQMCQRESGTMFLGVIASDGKVGPPILVLTSIKINAGVYQDILRQQLRPWINQKYAPGTWVFQQDGAPAHTAPQTQEMLCQEGWDFWEKDSWPPSSPDCALLNYAIWDRVAQEACCDRVPDIQTLKTCVEAAWHNLGTDFVRRCANGFIARLRRVVTAKGGRIE